MPTNPSRKGVDPGGTAFDPEGIVCDSEPHLDAFIEAMEALAAGDQTAALDCGLQRAGAHRALAARFSPELGGDVEQAAMAALLVHGTILG